MAKVLASRLKKVLGHIISEEKNRFTPEREIIDDIITSTETICTITSERLKSMIIKLDVSKAYDQVQWDFLIDVLVRFGFSSQWINMIHFCITTPRYSVLVNGPICGFLKQLMVFDKEIIYPHLCL